MKSLSISSFAVCQLILYGDCPVLLFLMCADSTQSLFGGSDHVFACNDRTDCTLEPPAEWKWVVGKFGLGSGQVPPYFAFRMTWIGPGKPFFTVGVRFASPPFDREYFCAADPHVFAVCSEDVATWSESFGRDKRPLVPSLQEPKCVTSAVHNDHIVSHVLSTLTDEERQQRLVERINSEKSRSTHTAAPVPAPAPIAGGGGGGGGGGEATIDLHLDVPTADTFAYVGAVIGVEYDTVPVSGQTTTAGAGTGTGTRVIRFYLNDKPLRVTSRVERRYKALGPSTVGDIYAMPIRPNATSPFPPVGDGDAVDTSTVVPYFASFVNVSVQLDNSWRPPPPPPASS